MPGIYLTPAAIGYLSQSILASVITVYLIYRAAHRRTGKNSTHAKLFIAVYASITLFCISLFLDTASLPTQRLYAVYLQNTVLALLLVFLLQFAYYFPELKPNHKLESRIALAVTLAYFAIEAGVAIWRFTVLLMESRVEYRPPFMDYLPVVEIIWIIIIFTRKGWKNPLTTFQRGFALIIIIPLWLALLNTLPLSREFVQINIHVGILVSTFLFAFNYIASLPETTSFMVKISGTFLIGMLAALSTIVWVITPTYTDNFSPNLIDRRTLLFSPNNAGGYDAREIPYRYELDLGERTSISTEGANIVTVSISYDYTYFGKPYSTIYISEDGVLSFGTPHWARNTQYHFGTVAEIFSAYIDLDAPTEGESGIYINKSDSRLVITWNKVPVTHAPQQTITMQVVFLDDGDFTITYNGLPELTYEANANPGDKFWVIGVRPELKIASTVNYSQLSLTVPPNGALQDEYKNFRIYLHGLMLPLATSILIITIILLIVLPILVDRALTRPLQRLMDGVQAVNRERRGLNLPVQANDEIGYLTASFNELTSELESLITGLESRVAKRTSDLVHANEQLRKLTTAIEQSTSTIVITDLNAKIEYVNPAFTNLTGYTFEEAFGQNPRILQSKRTPPGTYQEMWANLLAGNTWQGEICNIKKNGDEYWENMVVTPVRAEDGTPTHYIAIKENITARKHAEQELERLAITDALTGLFNRRYFDERTHEILERASQHPLFAVGILVIDIDHFKTINDQFGHEIGDLVLIQLSDLFRKTVRPTDILARYGGEEFVILLPRTPEAEACHVAERLREGVENLRIEFGAESIQVTISIGIASAIPGEENTLKTLFHHADIALYAAKQSGRNRCELWQAESQ